MKRPAFQFYPADWRNNAKLRRCSWAARGAWIDVMGLLHDSDEYGVLAWPLREIAQAIGCPLPLLRELADKGVLKGCDAGNCDPFTYAPRSGRKVGAVVTLIDSRTGPLWYSSRMVRDEYIRNMRGKDAHFDASPKGGLGEGLGAAPKVSPKPCQSDGSTASSSSSASLSQVGEVGGGGAGEEPNRDPPPVDNSPPPLPAEPDGTGSAAAPAAPPEPEEPPDPPNGGKPDRTFGVRFDGEVFDVSQAALDRWLDAYPSVDIERELAKYEEYLRCNPSHKPRNPYRGCSNWLAKAQRWAERDGMRAGFAPRRSAPARPGESADVYRIRRATEHG